MLWQLLIYKCLLLKTLWIWEKQCEYQSTYLLPSEWRAAWTFYKIFSLVFNQEITGYMFRSIHGWVNNARMFILASTQTSILNKQRIYWCFLVEHVCFQLQILIVLLHSLSLSHLKRSTCQTQRVMVCDGQCLHRRSPALSPHTPTTSAEPHMSHIRKLRALLH